MIIELRYASHPRDFSQYGTERIREEFLLPAIFPKNDIFLAYSMYDRYIVGGAQPGVEAIALETFDELKSTYFLERREMGIINVGGDAIVSVDGKEMPLGFKEGLYLGRENKEVTFRSLTADRPAKLYINSAPAHHTYPNKLVTTAEAEIVEMGSLETANHRLIKKLLVNSIVQTCQLQMGLTELKAGSVWNTMPAHVHNRRMEAYMYFEVPENQAVCHFMGKPDETRHVWMHNEQAILSPSWSIHCGSGTSNYTFIWGMAGENLDYGDMDHAVIKELR
ncbi:MAG: 5-dehydro-4-deoxy-D-glucuronate isomerase [Bacteroidota bacterium]